MAREIVFHPLAVEDLDALDDFIAKDSPLRAIAFVRRIKSRCETLSLMAERGPLRPDLGEGVRLLLCERRVVIAYRVEEASVTVLRIFYAGLDYWALLDDLPET